MKTHGRRTEVAASCQEGNADRAKSREKTQARRQKGTNCRREPGIGRKRQNARPPPVSHRGEPGAEKRRPLGSGAGTSESRESPIVGHRWDTWPAPRNQMNETPAILRTILGRSVPCGRLRLDHPGAPLDAFSCTSPRLAGGVRHNRKRHGGAGQNAPPNAPPNRRPKWHNDLRRGPRTDVFSGGQMRPDVKAPNWK